MDIEVDSIERLMAAVICFRQSLDLYDGFHRAILLSDALLGHSLYSSGAPSVGFFRAERMRYTRANHQANQ
jgi:hypothetical protein